MKIGIVGLSISECGKAGFYNDQEIGIGKKLCERGHDVFVYKCIEKKEDKKTINIKHGLKVSYFPSNKIGNNAIFNTNNLDRSLDVILCPGDIQLFVPLIYKWCKRNSILFIPYIGTIDSKSSNVFFKTLMSCFRKFIINIYKKCDVIAKTNYVKNQLNNLGVNNVKIAPVGLDFDILNNEYAAQDELICRKKLGFSNDDKIVLLVGRLESDRNPLDCVDVLKSLYEKNSKTKLLVIGSGSLKNELKKKFNEFNLLDIVNFVDKVPNNEMWKYYRISDLLFTFSKTEIFGMSILEAMYYEVPVYSINAPGPNDIIINGKTGYLVEDIKEMSKIISFENSEQLGKEAHNRIVSNFTWDFISNAIETIAFQKDAYGKNI